MSPAAQRLRLVLFCLACAALAAAAIGFAGGGQPPAPAPPPARSGVAPAAPLAPQPAASSEAAGLRATLGHAARRFLAAFFRYEIGELGPGVRRALRAAATPGFAAELLVGPPRRPPPGIPAAVPGRLTIAVASLSPPRALVSGAARRGGQAEQFSFVFEAVDGAWLASGPGE
ncbi:MAG TPA: hypothetical protein VNY83_05880 [Solirubrobacterales bacterium]|nr:hypothetical protein [Solirubrobacterales bacterium]